MNQCPPPGRPVSAGGQQAPPTPTLPTPPTPTLPTHDKSIISGDGLGSPTPTLPTPPTPTLPTPPTPTLPTPPTPTLPTPPTPTLPTPPTPTQQKQQQKHVSPRRKRQLSPTTTSREEEPQPDIEPIYGGRSLSAGHTQKEEITNNSNQEEKQQTTYTGGSGGQARIGQHEKTKPHTRLDAHMIMHHYPPEETPKDQAKHHHTTAAAATTAATTTTTATTHVIHPPTMTPENRPTTATAAAAPAPAARNTQQEAKPEEQGMGAKASIGAAAATLSMMRNVVYPEEAVNHDLERAGNGTMLFFPQPNSAEASAATMWDPNTRIGVCVDQRQSVRAKPSDLESNQQGHRRYSQTKQVHDVESLAEHDVAKSMGTSIDMASSPHVVNTAAAAAEKVEDRAATATEGYQCTICLQQIYVKGSRLGRLKCNHTFCFNCIWQWTTSWANTCPLCKMTFTEIRKVRYSGEGDVSNAADGRGKYSTRSQRRRSKYVGDGSWVFEETVTVEPRKPPELEDDFGFEGFEPDEPVMWLGACCVCDGDQNDDLLLLCDGCNAGYHTFCLKPPLSEVPQGSWFCVHCAGSSASRLSLASTSVNHRRTRHRRPTLARPPNLMQQRAIATTPLAHSSVRRHLASYVAAAERNVAQSANVMQHPASYVATEGSVAQSADTTQLATPFAASGNVTHLTTSVAAAGSITQQQSAVFDAAVDDAGSSSHSDRQQNLSNSNPESSGEHAYLGTLPALEAIGRAAASLPAIMEGDGGNAACEGANAVQQETELDESEDVSGRSDDAASEYDSPVSSAGAAVGGSNTDVELEASSESDEDIEKLHAVVDKQGDSEAETPSAAVNEEGDKGKEQELVDEGSRSTKSQEINVDGKISVSATSAAAVKEQNTAATGSTGSVMQLQTSATANSEKFADMSSFKALQLLFRSSVLVGMDVFMADQGVTVAAVPSGLPAASCGIKVGDIISSLDDKEVKQTSDVTEALEDVTPGDTLKVGVLRDADRLSLSLVVGSKEYSMEDILTLRRIGCIDLVKPTSQPLVEPKVERASVPPIVVETVSASKLSEPATGNVRSAPTPVLPGLPAAASRLMSVLRSGRKRDGAEAILSHRASDETQKDDFEVKSSRHVRTTRKRQLSPSTACDEERQAGVEPMDGGSPSLLKSQRKRKRQLDEVGASNQRSKKRRFSKRGVPLIADLPVEVDVLEKKVSAKRHVPILKTSRVQSLPGVKVSSVKTKSRVRRMIPVKESVPMKKNEPVGGDVRSGHADAAVKASQVPFFRRAEDPRRMTLNKLKRVLRHRLQRRLWSGYVNAGPTRSPSVKIAAYLIGFQSGRASEKELFREISDDLSGVQEMRYRSATDIGGLRKFALGMNHSGVANNCHVLHLAVAPQEQLHGLGAFEAEFGRQSGPNAGKAAFLQFHTSGNRICQFYMIPSRSRLWRGMMAKDFSFYLPEACVWGLLRIPRKVSRTGSSDAVQSTVRSGNEAVVPPGRTPVATYGNAYVQQLYSGLSRTYRAAVHQGMRSSHAPPVVSGSVEFAPRMEPWRNEPQSVPSEQMPQMPPRMPVQQGQYTMSAQQWQNPMSVQQGQFTMPVQQGRYTMPVLQHGQQFISRMPVTVYPNVQQDNAVVPTSSFSGDGVGAPVQQDAIGSVPPASFSRVQGQFAAQQQHRGKVGSVPGTGLWTVLQNAREDLLQQAGAASARKPLYGMGYPVELQQATQVEQVASGSTDGDESTPRLCNVKSKAVSEDSNKSSEYGVKADAESKEEEEEDPNLEFLYEFRR